MNPCFIPFLSVNRWLVGKGLVFALLGLLALDGGLCVTSAFALPGVTVSPSSIAFTGPVGPGPLTIPVTFTNVSASSVSFTWTDSISWIKAGYPAGTLSPGQSVTYNMTARISGMAAGSYSGTGSVTAGGVTKQVPITLTLSSGSLIPAIGLNTTSLGFMGTAGGGNPAAKTFSISNTGGGTLSWTVSDNAAWLALSPVSGTNNGTVTTSVNLTGLATGTYTSTVSVAATGTATKTLSVTLTVSKSSSTSGVTITPSAIAFTGTVGPGPLTIPVTFTNVGAAPVSFTWTDTISWISAGYPGGTLTPGQSRTYTMTARISGMAAGSYSGTGTVTAGGVTKQVPVTLALSSTTLAPAIGLNTTSLGFAGTVGGTNLSVQTIGISNVGSGTLTWIASDSAAWLALSPVSGTNSGTVTTSVNLTGLAAGTYNATIAITATGATTKTIPVSLTVTASTSSGTGFSISPPTLAYTATVGSADKTGSMTVKNTGATAITVTWADSINWLYGITPGFTQTIQPGLSGTYTLKARLANLAAGSYSGTATISGGGITKQVPATLTLTVVTATNAAGLTWNANSETNLSGYKVYQRTSSGAYVAPVATLPKTTTSYTVTGLQTGTTYFFVITAYNNAGYESLHSSEVSKSIY